MFEGGLRLAGREGPRPEMVEAVAPAERYVVETCGWRIRAHFWWCSSSHTISRGKSFSSEPTGPHDPGGRKNAPYPSISSAVPPAPWSCCGSSASFWLCLPFPPL